MLENVNSFKDICYRRITKKKPDMKQNIFDNIPNKMPEEIFETMVDNKNVKVEKIISRGHSSPNSSWYDQDEDEWVLLLKGHAKLQFENDEMLELLPGDYINIPANKKHRVEWTDPEDATIWLAVFY